VSEWEREWEREAEGERERGDYVMSMSDSHLNCLSNYKL